MSEKECKGPALTDMLHSNVPHDNDNQHLLGSLRNFRQDVQDFCSLKSLDVLDGPPSPLTFYRDYVSKSRPVIIKNAINDWPALMLWQDYEYLKSKLGKKNVTVAITPNGYADAVEGKFFVTPHYQVMKMELFLNILRGIFPKNLEGVYYIQKQNSNFIEEFNEIHRDAMMEIPWANEAFGTSPDAVNFWMGEGAAVTSMHKDHYENIYCVVSGEKHFILHPPTDIACIPYDIYKSAHYELDGSSQLHIVEDDGPDVPWVSVNPLDPDLVTHPQYANATPIHCTLKAGDMLYLPSLWFHHLRQSHGAIAVFAVLPPVNFWYDMEFGMSYCYYKLLESLTQPKLKHIRL